MTRSHLRRAAFLISLAVSAPSFIEAAPLEVLQVSPGRNTLAPAPSAIIIDFDKPVNPASVSPATVRVFGRWSGPGSGTFTFLNGNQRVVFQPEDPFSAGETVRINLSHDLEASDMTFLRAAGYAWQFSVMAAPSDGQFQEIDVMSNRVDNIQTRIYGATASDLNEDGYLDLCTINEVSADVRVTLNRADGSGLYQAFLAPQGIGEEASPNEPADFNNDGHADICVCATTAQSVYILLGAGDGTFFSIQQVTVGNSPHGIAPLDVDGDGDLDIVNANVASNNLSLMINDGAGVFPAPAFFDGGVNGEYGLAAGDMNNDGITDLVVGGRFGSEIRTLLGNGKGTFSPAAPAQLSGGATWVVAVDDLNGDGDLDATTANSFSNTGARLLGDGGGGFGFPFIINMGGHTVSTDHGDLDGDGDLDWLLSSFGGGTWRLYLNDGAGNFTFDQEFLAPSNPSCAILYDSDNDGDVDMALTDEIADVVMLMRNTGPTGVGESPSPARLTLLPNAPNPMRAGTWLRFALPREAPVRIDVIDVLGRVVASDRLSRRKAGWQDYFFNGLDASGRRLTAGVYVYRVASEGDVRVGKLSVAR